jgi:hypothetical protein
MAEEGEVSVVRVSFRGAAHEVSAPRGATLAQLGALLAARTGAEAATLRLLSGGRAVALGDAAASERTLDEAGLISGGAAAPRRLMLLGATAAEVADLSAAPMAAAAHAAAAREAPPEHAAQVALRRRGRAAARVILPPGPHTFAAFRALDAPPGLALTPSPAAALRLLHTLAADAGIASLLSRHRWRVGLLSEMPPEGKVGVSESCVLGYNVNKGQEIALRLRTDDWRGFRRYERIRETLIHELAHMVHSEHGFPFKALNSALTVQAAAADWTRGRAHTLRGGGDTWQSDDAAWDAAEEGDAMGTSGKMLGGDSLGACACSPHAAAAAAAQRRAAEAAAAAAEAAMAAEAAAALAAQQAEEQTCDAAVADADAAAADAAAAAAAPELAAPTHADALLRAPAEPPAAAAQAAEPSAAVAPPDEAEAMQSDDGAAGAHADVDMSSWSITEDNGDPALSRLAAGAADARARAVAAAAALSGPSGAPPAEADAALRTLAAVLRNALAHPGAPHFRVLRRSNAAFESRAGRFPAARELLRCAGFIEEAEPGAAAQGARRLRLARDDPALLWLALSAVNEAMEARAAGRPVAAA